MSSHVFAAFVAFFVAAVAVHVGFQPAVALFVAVAAFVATEEMSFKPQSVMA